MKHRPAILVLNTDQAISQLIQDVLEPDFQVYATADSRQAFNLLFARRIDVLMVEPFFLTGSGLNCARALRSFCTAYGIPLVAMIDSEATGRRIGPADATLTCPFSLSELYGVVAHALQASLERGCDLEAA